MSTPDPFELPAPLLDAVLARLAGADGAAAEAILAELVAAHPEHSEGLRALSGALYHAGRLLADSFAPPLPAEPANVDAYRVLRRLGEGAFGVVYLCAQERPIRRQVAVKVLRPGAGDRGTLQRFAAEQQLLATFQHPAIARVIDAGTLPDGRPYFAMEYVDGVPITHYCDTKRLPVEARLGLFLGLCEGVEHAHLRSIVHRDLKPANVLVAECDSKPTPKIIDFGVAKALTVAHDGAAATAPGRVVGTPGYMSPEQASGDPSGVDVRADVFALGVMLYELLAGSLPWGRDVASTTTHAQRPSTRLHSEPRATEVAAARATEPRALAGRLRSELDWIVLKALHPDRELRYQSASALIADVKHHLHGEPVGARPPSVGYRLRKVLRRHRAMVAVAAAVALAALGITGTYAFRHDALASETARLEAIDDAVQALIARAFDPRVQDAPWSDDMQKDTLRDALALHDRVLRERSASPRLRELRVHVLNGIADVHFRCGEAGEYRQSIELSVEAEREAETLLRELGDVGNLRRGRAVAQRNLARCHMLLGNRAEASAWSSRAVAACARLHESDAGRYANLFARVLVEHATALRGANDTDGELAAQRRAIALLEEHVRSRPEQRESVRDLVRFRCGLSGMLSARGEAQEAESVVMQAQSLAERSGEVTDDERALVHRRLARLYLASGRRQQEAAALTKAVDLTAGVLQQHPGRKEMRERQREMRTALSEALYVLGRGEAADRESELAVSEGEALGPDYPTWRNRLADTLGRLGWAAVAAQRFARHEALDAWLQRAQDLAQGATDQVSRTVLARVLVARGFVCRDLGRPYGVAQWEEAVAAARDALPQMAGLARIELMRRRRKLGDLAGARTALAELTAAGDPVPPWRLGREAYQLAIAERDPAAAARAAEACIMRDESWTGMQVAAEAFTAAGRLARQQAGTAEAAVAPAWLARATALWEGLIPALEAAPEPWPTGRLRDLFVAQARAQLANLCADSTRPRELREAALPVLDRQRRLVEASWWDETIWVESHAAAVRAELAGGAFDRARDALSAFARELDDPTQVVTAARLWTELACAARQAHSLELAQAAEDSALATLRRAVALGFRGRRRLLDDSELAALHSHPAFREIVASVPD